MHHGLRRLGEDRGGPRASIAPAFLGRILVEALLLALAVFAVSRAAERSPTRLEGLVDDTMRTRAEMAIAHGERVVEVSSRGGNAEFGWQIGDALQAAGVKARCVGVCGSAAAHIVLGSRGCIVARSGHVILHVAMMEPGGPVAKALTSTQFAMANDIVRKAWFEKALAHGISSDLLEGTVQAPNHQYELNAYQMRRIGCTVE
jgi:hypothetical protein